MSEKFDMKLVIDAVTTPLLHARLSRTSSYRERAALLRSLAEAALRGQGLAGMEAAPSFAGAVTVTTEARPAAARLRQPEKAPNVVPEATVDTQQSQVQSNDGGPVRSYDINEIADAFSSFI
ncbi:hypothetical protein BJG93_33060 (plasmid) [Paraburkholderia sprentiae WSM5005]|uniref:Uncharacterized protein n=1 Tax=Paraburkholderia sprentiae WSM5005 TaxID=754502 RepID=A0A1I9YW21_9BURK|nr:hypothetical protein [Paraburkholderia sprentiae]APA90421.1 hypothetical protein BJG93_33060 [Paraburkholderia sprentiae WSM5005]